MPLPIPRTLPRLAVAALLAAALAAGCGKLADEPGFAMEAQRTLQVERVSVDLEDETHLTLVLEDPRFTGLPTFEEIEETLAAAEFARDRFPGFERVERIGIELRSTESPTSPVPVSVRHTFTREHLDLILARRAAEHAAGAEGH